jgi:hypothetical protein
MLAYDAFVATSRNIGTATVLSAISTQTSAREPVRGSHDSETTLSKNGAST